MIEVKRLVNDDTERAWYELDGVDPVTDMGFSEEVYMISRHCAQVLDEFRMTPGNPDKIRTVYRLANQYEAAYIAAGMPGREDYTLCLYPEAAISDFDMKSGGLQSYEEPAPNITLKSIRSFEYKTRIEPTSTTEVNEQCKRYAEAGAELAKHKAEYAKFEAAENDRIANLYGHGSLCAETFLAMLEADFQKFLSSPEWLGAPLIKDTSIEDAFSRMPLFDDPCLGKANKTEREFPSIELPIQLSAHVQIDPPGAIVHKVELLPGTPSTLCYTNSPGSCGECANYKLLGGCKFEMGLKEPNTKCTNEKFLPAGS